MQAPSIGQSGMTDRGFPIDTIPYDARMGLLPRAGRAGRFRRYTDTGVARMAFVRRARELGLPLEHVRALLRLAARAHLADHRARIADLRAMASVLDILQPACVAGALGACPVIASLADAA